MKNFKIEIQYDGTSYHGWQKQPTKNTIQGEIEKALKIMTGERVGIQGSGRTDAGVHAIAQIANYKCDTKIMPSHFKRGINGLTGDDINIRSCEIVPEEFHSRFSAIGKIYNYRILNTPKVNVFERNYSCFFHRELNTDEMQKAADYLIGEKDFKSFENTGSPRTHTVRIIKRAGFKKEGDFLNFEIEGNGFLRNMVRNIVGTLTEVGLGNLSSSDFKAIIESKDRSNAGTTAPACGLFLKKVLY